MSSMPHPGEVPRHMDSYPPSFTDVPTPPLGDTNFVRESGRQTETSQSFVSPSTVLGKLSLHVINAHSAEPKPPEETPESANGNVPVAHESQPVAASSGGTPPKPPRDKPPVAGGFSDRDDNTPDDSPNEPSTPENTVASTPIPPHPKRHMRAAPTTQDVSILSPRRKDDDGKPATLKGLYDMRQDNADFRTGNYIYGEQALKEFGRSRWPIDNSPLEGDYGRNVESFASWFEDTLGPLPPGQTLRGDIETTLESSQDRRLLEVGGIGSRLSSGFTRGFFSSSRGVALVDSRAEAIALDDAERKHGVIEGDIMSDETFQKVDAWLGNSKVDCIISRMYGGVQSLPADPFKLAALASKLYDRLAPNGLLLAQVHPEVHDDMDRWKKVITEQTPHIDLRVGIHIDASGRDNAIIRLHKKPGAPESLPLIQSKEMVQNRMVKEREYLFGRK